MLPTEIVPRREIRTYLRSTDLQTLLGEAGTLEDFESFTIDDGFATNIDAKVLDSNAIANGQGPGLVVAGVRFTWPPGIGPSNGQWDGAAYYGSFSKEILTNYQRKLDIDFTGVVTAFGVDLRTYTGYGSTATISIFGPDDSTLIGLVSSINLPDDGTAVFAGWTDVSGIGRVELAQHDNTWSPIIDNLEFGSRGVPEPSAIWLALAAVVGLVLVRRS